MPSRPHFLAVFSALAAASLLGSGCSGVAMPVAARNLPLEEIARYSPAPETVSAQEAIDGAQQYVRAHPGADFAIGSGDSMLPLYRDHAVIVTERPALDQLHVGQTVVFMGPDGVPVAHVLIARTGRGWVTMGLANGVPDEGALTDSAYMGVVVKAYQPTGSPILAYAKPQVHAEEFASNP